MSFGTRPQMEAALDKLGQAWEISALAYKPYPSGFVIHPIIDACLEIAQKNTFDAAHIERIELTVNPMAVQLCNRPAPKIRNQALVSLQHWTAVSLIYKAAGVAEIAEPILHDPLVAAVRGKITHEVRRRRRARSGGCARRIQGRQNAAGHRQGLPRQRRPADDRRRYFRRKPSTSCASRFPAQAAERILANAGRSSNIRWSRRCASCSARPRRSHEYLVNAKTALIAGASGLIGRRIAEHLLAAGGWNVIGLARHPRDAQNNMRWIAVDLNDPADCKLKLGALE